MGKIRVLIVDDSVVFRELLIKSLKSDPTFEVVAAVGDAYQARDAIVKYRPHVMALDIEMPRMDGIVFLKKLMPQYPIPTIIVSAMNDRVFDALEAGAVDFINKPVNMNRFELEQFMAKELGAKLKMAALVRVPELKSKVTNVRHRTVEQKIDNNNCIIAIGASTGGTEAIYEVVRHFKRDIPGTVIVQHMPPGFTAMYAERLNNQCDVIVKEAKTGDRVVTGQVLIAPGDSHMTVVKIADGYQVECKKGAKVSGHCPSVDVLFSSVAKAAGKNALGVILTGMGKDGADGLLEMRRAGARTLGQNESSCVVYGMPKVAYTIGAVEQQADLSVMAQKIYSIIDAK